MCWASHSCVLTISLHPVILSGAKNLTPKHFDGDQQKSWRCWPCERFFAAVRLRMTTRKYLRHGTRRQVGRRRCGGTICTDSFRANLLNRGASAELQVRWGIREKPSFSPRRSGSPGGAAHHRRSDDLRRGPRRTASSVGKKYVSYKNWGGSLRLLAIDGVCGLGL